MCAFIFDYFESCRYIWLLLLSRMCTCNMDLLFILHRSYVLTYSWVFLQLRCCCLHFQQVWSASVICRRKHQLIPRSSSGPHMVSTQLLEPQRGVSFVIAMCVVAITTIISLNVQPSIKLRQFRQYFTTICIDTSPFIFCNNTKAIGYIPLAFGRGSQCDALGLAVFNLFLWIKLSWYQHFLLMPNNLSIWKHNSGDKNVDVTLINQHKNN